MNVEASPVPKRFAANVALEFLDVFMNRSHMNLEAFFLPKCPITDAALKLLDVSMDC